MIGSGFFTLDDSVDGFAGFVALDVVEVVEGIILQHFLSLTITRKLTYNNTNKIIHFIHIL